MKVAITGGTGFIGYPVVQELVAKNFEVILIHRSPAPDLISLPGVTSFPCSLDASDLPTFQDIGSPDVLIHLAWGGLPNYHSPHHFETELPNAFRFLSHLIRTGLRSVTVAGTCFEYGMVSGSLSESLPALPDNAYGFAKHSLYQQLHFLQSQENFGINWVRFFYLYGAGQGPKSLRTLLENAVARGDKSFPMSGGQQLRDFLPVNEAASHFTRLATEHDNAGIVNICSGSPVSVRSLVESWIADHNWTIELELGAYPYPDHEPMAFWGDNEKLARILGCSSD